MGRIMSDFLARLKQRKLVQWALAYTAAAFALIQVVDVVAQRFGWPDRAEKLVILALAVGFFVTLVLAWYHGERGAQKVSSVELLILALLLAVVFCLLLPGWRAVVGAAVAVLVFVLWRRACLQRLGGMTGDTCGALTELVEAAVLIVCVCEG